MVPFAILPGGSGFVIHVSQLATHTKDMLLSPQVSLLVVAPPLPEIPAQALARVTIQAQAVPYADLTQGQAEAKAAYLARFPFPMSRCSQYCRAQSGSSAGLLRQQAFRRKFSPAC
jgi:hypothetical protein